ncbi:MAG: gliding motility lipoprotein GldH [Bacteroidia bacterium]|nr:gliding motility lipoprotein GldH [Bacteroidia bacterium]
MKSVFPILITAIVLLSSCGQDNFTFSHRFPSECWGIQDTIHVALEKKDGKVGQLLVDLKEEFPFQNFYVKVMYTGPDGSEKELLLNQRFASAAGLWELPKTNSYYRVPYDDLLDFEGPDGTYKCRIIQFMREDEVCEIKQVAISGL